MPHVMSELPMSPPTANPTAAKRHERNCETARKLASAPFWVNPASANASTGGSPSTTEKTRARCTTHDKHTHDLSCAVCRVSGYGRHRVIRTAYCTYHNQQSDR